MAYDIDVFLSFDSRGYANQWVRIAFWPMFVQVFSDIHGEANFYSYADRKDDAGTRWEDHVGASLVKSKVIVPILNAAYFSSSVWCRREWQTMIDRQQTCDTTYGVNKYTIIFPILYQDGKSFPPITTSLILSDFKKYNATSVALHTHPQHAEFLNEIQKLVQTISYHIQKPPPFDPKWAVSADPGAPPRNPSEFPSM